MMVNNFPTIPESNMNFIFNPKNSVYIEKRFLYKNILVSKGFRTVEFIKLENNEWQFIEAKNKKDISFTELCEKFVHSVEMLSSVQLGVNSFGVNSEYSFDNLSIFTPNLNTPHILKFILVDKDCTDIRMNMSKKALTKKLQKDFTHFFTIWRPEIEVYNEKAAQKANLVE
jgi:hypothetical protein